MSSPCPPPVASPPTVEERRASAPEWGPESEAGPGSTDAPPDERLELTPGWLAVGIAAVALGIAMGFIMSSAWLVR